MKVCFLLTHVPDPKTNKRIDFFHDQGDVVVICARRKSQNIYEPNNIVKHTIFDIDLPPSRNILKRFWVSQTYQIKSLRAIMVEQPDIIYADGFDSLLVASRYKRKKQIKLVYDVADLREIFLDKPKSLIKRIVINGIKYIEKRSFLYVDWLVVSSLKFYDIHYHSLIDKKNVLFIPNAPKIEVFSGYKKKNDGIFTVGFIGGIRYLTQMKMLVDAAKETKVKVLFAGAGGTDYDYKEIEQYCRDKDWVTFTGKYNYDSDISTLYGLVDCVYAVYDADNSNVKIALPNKLYEAVYCNLPIIVAKNTYLAEVVNEWGIGVAIDHKSVEELVYAINTLSRNKELYDRFCFNCKKQAEYIDGSAVNYTQLKKIIR